MRSSIHPGRLDSLLLEFGVQEATGRSGMSSKFAVDDYPFLGVVLAIIPIFAVFGFLFIFLAGFGRNFHPFVVGVVLPLEFCLCLLSSTRRFLFLFFFDFLDFCSLTGANTVVVVPVASRQRWQQSAVG